MTCLRVTYEVVDDHGDVLAEYATRAAAEAELLAHKAEHPDDDLAIVEIR
jgi:hypothetical protein